MKKGTCHLKLLIIVVCTVIRFYKNFYFNVTANINIKKRTFQWYIKSKIVKKTISRCVSDMIYYIYLKNIILSNDTTVLISDLSTFRQA